jgi:predicted alternative tryptophan synthase beta-subunit
VLLPHPPSSLLLLLLLLLLQVWQVRASYDAKPYRKTIMQTW